MPSSITTAEELLRAQDIGRCELVRGELRLLIPPGADHGRVAMALGRLIANHVVEHDLGSTYAAETGFLLARDPDTVRAPDVAFVRAGRPATPERGYYPGAPDLVVEVLSPDDRPGYVREKVAEWLEGGALAVWVVDPRARTVAVHEPRRRTRTRRETDTIRGGDVLPGFAVPVAGIFGPAPGAPPD
jgi:Uma2 family endonuclease